MAFNLSVIGRNAVASRLLLAPRKGPAIAASITGIAAPERRNVESRGSSFFF